MSKSFVIKLSTSNRSRARYLKSYRYADSTVRGRNVGNRMTMTNHIGEARGFATLEEAIEFRDSHSAGMLVWTVVTRDEVAQ